MSQEKSSKPRYSDLAGDNQRKVPIPARVDLRDLYTALAGVREVFDIPMRTHSKSSGIQAIAEAFARLVYEQGFIDPSDVPTDMKQAAQKLELEAGWEFNTKQQQRAIADGDLSGNDSPSLDKVKRGKELREKVEEEMEQSREGDIEKEKERLKRQARERGNLVDEEKASGSEEESVDVTKVFRQIKEIGSPATALIQLAQNSGWSNKAIAKELKPVAESGEIDDSTFLSYRDLFENEPQE